MKLWLKVLLLIIALGAMAYLTYLNFDNPEMTRTQRAIVYWKEYAVATILLVPGAFIWFNETE